VTGHNDTSILKVPTLPENAAMPLWSVQIVGYLTEDGVAMSKPYITGDVSLPEVVKHLEMTKLQFFSLHNREINGPGPL
jgi:hypothetical protein